MIEDSKTIKAAKKALQGMDKAGRFGDNTTPVCRCVAGIAYDLVGHGKSNMIELEPIRIGGDIAMVVGMLWDATTLLQSLGYARENGKWVKK